MNIENPNYYLPFKRRSIQKSNFLKYNRLVKVILFATLFIIYAPQSGWCKRGGSEEKEDSSSAGIGDSIEDDLDMEMPEYLDDEVRFVTEDDFFNEESRSQDVHQFQDGGLGNGKYSYERCPPFPDPSAIASSGLCDMKRCQRDVDCSNDASIICCYNGCIYSCMPKVNPPVAFDWLEETDMKFGSPKDHNSLLPDPRIEMSPRSLLHASSSSPETIALPGGCFLDHQQYNDLIVFKRNDHVKACSCSKGEVFCEVNHQQDNAT